MLRKNTLYHGDNLDVLRRHVGDDTGALVYLHPPFKANADYDVLSSQRMGPARLRRSRPSKHLEWSDEAAAA